MSRLPVAIPEGLGRCCATSPGSRTVDWKSLFR